MRSGLKSLFSYFAVCGLTLFFSLAASGYDQQISSDLWAEGYSIETADGSMIKRRNIAEDLHLGAWNLLPGSDDPYYQGPRLSVELELRIGGDYGVESRESSSHHMEEYVPGLAPLDAQAIFAYVDIEGIGGDFLNIRAGRQIGISTIGYFAFDGVDVDMHFPLGFGLSSFIGYEVKAAHPLGYDSLEIDGVDNGGRDEIDESYYRSRTDPLPRLSFGSELSFAPSSWFDSGVAIRLVGIGKDLSSQTVGMRLATYHQMFKSYARVIMNPMFDRSDSFSEAVKEGTLVSEAELSLGVRIVPDGWLSVEYQLFRPVFMAESIFNVFGLIPRRDLGLRFEKSIGSKLSAGGWGFVRFSDESAGLSGSQDSSAVSGIGGGTGANYYKGSGRMSLRLSAQKEWGATSIGIDAGGGRSFIDERLWLGLRCSFWHTDDQLISTGRGSIAGYVASARLQINSSAKIIGEFENYYGGGKDPRFITFISFQLDLWI